MYVGKSKQMNEEIDRLLQLNGGVVRTGDAVKAGLSRMAMVNLVKAGALERVAHGIYTRPGEIYDEMYVLQLRSDRIVFSHETALWLNRLSDRAPIQYHVTVPTKAPLGGALRGDCVCHYVKPELHGLGATVRKTAFGHEVRCYDSERTICDMVRNERRVDVELLVAGLRAYAARKDKDILRLVETARAFSVEKEVSRYMGVLT